MLLYCYSTTTKELAVYFSVYDLEFFTLDKSKYFVKMKSQKDFFIANVNVYRYSNLIKN